MRLSHLLFRHPTRFRRRAFRSRIRTMLFLLLILLLLLLPFYLIYMPPTLLIRHFQRRWPAVLWRVSTTSKTIALTIDDAPSQHTTELLSILAANNATATFFLIGSQIPGHEAILQRMVRAGHELANHAMHDEPSRSLSDTNLADEITSVHASIHAAYAAVDVAPPPPYFRPGSGFFSGRMMANLRTLGYKLVLGSIYPHDAQVSWWRVNARHVLMMAKPGGIIICHDRRSWTPPMLRKVLPELGRMGYRIVTITELLKEEQT